MKNLGFSRSLDIALCKGTAQNLDNFLQRKTECSAKCEGLKFISHTAEVLLSVLLPPHPRVVWQMEELRMPLLNVEGLLPAMGLRSLGCILGTESFFGSGRRFIQRWAMLFPIPRNRLKRSQRVWGADVDELQRWRWDNGKWWCITV